MQLVRFEVDDLLGKKKRVSADFHPDLNILTGRNGAGKTSLIKLIWYVMSGNIYQALKEVSFSRFQLVTTKYDVVIYRLSPSTCKIEFTEGNRRHLFEDELDSDGDSFRDAEDQANPRVMKHGSSVLFPTFRRIEGGFTLDVGRRRTSNSLNPFGTSSKSDVEEALTTLSRRLTNEKHSFVSSISTADIVGLLLSQYAELSQRYSEIQQNTSEGIINTIKAQRFNNNPQQELLNANLVLEHIQSEIEKMEGMREKVMLPFDTVRKLVEKLFRHTGINFGSRLSFGDAAKAVASDALSAGEKQMLSFICYNAFNKNAVLLIDEPELSLHVDWQRQLFPILLNQKSSNQFIIATHSPFIYGNYPDKEVQIDLDRGDSGRP